MTLEQILALLVAKFTGVRKDGLAQMARTISLQATTEEEAQAIIDKLDTEKVKAAVTDFRKDVDKEVSESNKTFESNLKKKFKFVPAEEDDPGKVDPAKVDPNDISSIVKAAVAEAVKPFQDEITTLKGSKVNETRQQKFEALFKDVPEGTFRSSQTKDFGRIVKTFETEEDFEAFLSEKQSDIDAFNQEMADSGLSQHGKPVFGQQKNKDGISTGVADFIASQEQSESSLGGKEV